MNAMKNDNNMFRHLSKEQISEENLNGSEVLHDYKGNLYQVSDAYYNQQISRRTKKDTFKRQKARQIIDQGFKMLSVQQRKVIRYVLRGWTEQRIADLLHISHQRVNRIKKAISKKLKNYIPSIQEEE